MKLLVLLFLGICGSLFAGKVESLLFLGDPQEALCEVRSELQKNPDDKELRRLELLTLAKLGDISSLLKAFKSYPEREDAKLLEEISWAILSKGAKSHSPIIRQEAFLGAFMTNDARGIPLCLEAMDDPNIEVRSFAMHYASALRDELLIQKALYALADDTSKKIRLQAIETVGRMRSEKAKDPLTKILELQNSDVEEKMAASFALSHITKEKDAKKIVALATSERAFSRLSACELVLNNYDRENGPLLFPLINDSIFDVRMAAIQCIGILGLKPPQEAIEKLLLHPDIKTKILANWLLLDLDKERALHAFQQFLLLDDREMRLFAAACMSHADIHVQSNDPLVMLNLAVGKIWQRRDVQNAANTILEAMNEPIRLSRQKIGLISVICPSTSHHVSGVARVPETEDLMLRLELYSMVATCGIDIQKPLRNFLKERTWGISGQSALLLMQENPLFIEELSKLLKDESQEIALQAAFILASYAQDEEALGILMSAYPKVSRQMKEYILFAMASIGAKSALSFLVEVLNEPFETLRISAARGILLSLNK